MTQETTNPVGEERRLDTPEAIREQCGISPQLQVTLNQSVFDAQDYEVRNEDGEVLRTYTDCDAVETNLMTTSPSDMIMAGLDDIFVQPEDVDAARNTARSAVDGELVQETVTVTAQGPRAQEPNFAITFDDAGNPIYTQTDDGAVRIPIGDRFAVQFPREAPFNVLDNAGVNNFCSEDDVSGGVLETIGGYIALAEEAVRPSSFCASVSSDNREEVLFLDRLGANTLGDNNRYRIGPNGQRFDSQDVDDVMDIQGCTNLLGADACAGVSEDGAGLSISRRW